MRSAMLDHLGLILGNFYLPDDLREHYGALPPPFLPFGLAPLYATQIKALRQHASRIVLVVPQGFRMPAHDLRALTRLECEVISAPECGSACETLAALRDRLRQCGAVTILNGDAMPLADAGTGRGPAAFDLQNAAAFFAGAAAPAFGANTELGFMGRADFKAYYGAKIQSATKRFFNAITVEGDWVRKSATDQSRILFESAWFDLVPAAMRAYLPAFMPGDDGTFYRTGLVRLPLVSELLLGSAPVDNWRPILANCAGFLKSCHAEKPGPGVDRQALATGFHRDLIVQKSYSRAEQTCRQLGVNPDAGWVVNGRRYPSLMRTVETLVDIVTPTCADDIGFWHGDFHFGNIFSDRNQGSIKVIDPRGSVDSDSPCAFGDIRYDMAKLSHSITGLYDLILSGRFQSARLAATEVQFSFDTGTIPGLDRLQAMFSDLQIGRRRFTDCDIAALTALMFLTMPPLHKDRPDRQWAMLANGFRLAHALFHAPVAVPAALVRRQNDHLSAPVPTAAGLTA